MLGEFEKPLIFALHFHRSLGGGIGRRAGFKIQFLRECGFDSRPRYQSLVLRRTRLFSFQTRPAICTRKSVLDSPTRLSLIHGTNGKAKEVRQSIPQDGIRMGATQSLPAQKSRGAHCEGSNDNFRRFQWNTYWI